MITLLTVLTLCTCSAISIMLIYFTTCALLEPLKKYTSYVVFGGYMIFIPINLFIWLYLYEIVYTKWESASFGPFTPIHYLTFF